MNKQKKLLKKMNEDICPCEDCEKDEICKEECKEKADWNIQAKASFLEYIGAKLERDKAYVEKMGKFRRVRFEKNVHKAKTAFLCNIIFKEVAQQLDDKQQNPTFFVESALKATREYSVQCQYLMKKYKLSSNTLGEFEESWTSLDRTGNKTEGFFKEIL